MIFLALEPTTAPEFIVPVSNTMARAGQKIKLECQVAGLPPPEVTWSHNGKPVKENRDLKVSTIVLILLLIFVIFNKFIEFVANYCK